MNKQEMQEQMFGMIEGIVVEKYRQKARFSPLTGAQTHQALRAFIWTCKEKYSTELDHTGRLALRLEQSIPIMNKLHEFMINQL